MKDLRKLITILILVGIVLCIYGWTQSFLFSADSNYAIRIIKFYVFICTGVTLIITSLMLNRVVEVIKEEMGSLSDKYSELERYVDRLSTNNDTKIY